MQPADTLYVPAAQFGPQRVAIDAQQICGSELVAIGGGEAGAQKRRLDFREHAFVEAARRKVLAE